MARRETNDPASPLYQADLLGTGLGPNDSQIDDNDAAGPANVLWPTPDYSMTDPQVDGVEVGLGDRMPAPPPGSIARHVEVDESDYNMLADRRDSMLDGSENRYTGPMEG